MLGLRATGRFSRTPPFIIIIIIINQSDHTRVSRNSIITITREYRLRYVFSDKDFGYWMVGIRYEE